MSLVRIFTSRTATELEAIISVLEARAVPCFVRDNVITSRTNPGQLLRRACSTLLVPAEHVPKAVQLIGALQHPNGSLQEPAAVRLGRAILAAFRLRPPGWRLSQRGKPE